MNQDLERSNTVDFRISQLEVQDDLGTSGTSIYKLDYLSPITRIDLLFEATNGASHNKENPIEINISKIELVDGSDVLWSLNGKLALARCAQLNGKMPYCYRTEAASDSPYQTIPIEFGRFYGDTELAFNPKAFQNPQLKVTFDEATTRAASTTGYVSDSFVLSISVHLMENAPIPSGFLSSKQILDFTSVDSGDKRISMPVDRPYRFLFVSAWKDETDVRSIITNYKLDCAGGSWLPINMHARFVAEMQVDRFNYFELNLTGMLSHVVYTKHYIAFDNQGQVCSGAAAYFMGASTFWPGSVRPYVYFHDGTTSNNQVGRVVLSGLCLHATQFIPFGLLDKPETWLNVAAKKPIYLYLTQGVADAECFVGVEQLRTY